VLDENIKQMCDKAQQTMANAYNPYSNFFVGACLLADDGNYYVGCNVENVSYSLTICAENNAIGNMIAAGGKKIKSMVIVADCEKIISPCGACRQVIAELANPDTKIYMFNKNNDYKVRTIAELLPDTFDTGFLTEAE